MNKHVARQHAVSPEVEERLERVAERLKVPVDQLVEDALSEFLDRAEADQQWLAELHDRSREMRETGLHIAHDEVSDWLRKLARGERPPRPKAHT